MEAVLSKFEMKTENNYMIVIKPDVKDWEIQVLISIPKLDVLKTGLDGGLLEVVPRFNNFMGRDCVVFCDEEGKLKGLKHNNVAHWLWEQSYGRSITNDYLVGPIVIIVGSSSFLAQL